MQALDSLKAYTALLHEATQLEHLVTPTKPNTLAQVFRKAYDENFLSNWLAFLLDPTKMKTTSPLNMLLALIHEGENIHRVSPGEEVIVEREYVFEGGRRIDLLISTDKALIGIENKVWSWEGVNQLADYRQSLDMLTAPGGQYAGKVAYLVFLKPDRNLCKSTEREVITLSYERLAEGFKSIQTNFIDNLRESFLLLDFITYIEEYLMKNSFVATEWTKFLAENSNLILQLRENSQQTLFEFKAFLDEKVKTLCEENEGWEINGHRQAHFVQLYKAGWEKYGIHFEIITTNENGAYQTPDINSNKVYTLPQYYKLELHCEGKNLPKAAFAEIAEQANAEYSMPFAISYTPDGLKGSISRLIEALADLQEKYTQAVDAFILAQETKP